MTKSSTKPKGATSYKETTFGIIPRNKLLPLETEGIKKGLEFVHELASKSYPIEITPELIRKLHKISFGWIFPDWAGEYRTVQVEFSGKEAILYHLVPEQMINLCADLKERLKHLDTTNENYIEKVVELLAWFQHHFVFIHPFLDYNGRVARMLTSLILLDLQLPPAEINAETSAGRKKYLQAMYAADEGNFKKLETLISQALNESLQKIRA